MEMGPSGDRLAILEQGTVSVHELDGERLLAAARLPAGRAGDAGTEPSEASIRFSGRDRLRIFRLGAGRVEVLELDLTGRRLESLAALAINASWLVPSPDGSTLFLREGPRQERRNSLRDGRTLEVLATLPGGPSVGWPAFLADGRLAMGLAQGDRLSLVVQAVAGTPALEIDLGRCEHPPCGMRIGGEVRPGLLAVRAAGATALVAVNEASVVERFDGHGPVLSPWHGRAEPASLAARLLQGPDGALVEIDPGTLELRTVRPGVPPLGDPDGWVGRLRAEWSG
jgi:hypothetical protein